MKNISFSDVVKYAREDRIALSPEYIQSILGTSDRSEILKLLSEAALEYIMPDENNVSTSKITITTMDDQDMARHYHESQELPPLDDFEIITQSDSYSDSESDSEFEHITAHDAKGYNTLAAKPDKQEEIQRPSPQPDNKADDFDQSYVQVEISDSPEPERAKFTDATHIDAKVVHSLDALNKLLQQSSPSKETNSTGKPVSPVMTRG